SLDVEPKWLVSKSADEPGWSTLDLTLNSDRRRWHRATRYHHVEIHFAARLCESGGVSLDRGGSYSLLDVGYALESAAAGATSGRPSDGAYLSARILLGRGHLVVPDRGRLERGRQGRLDLGHLYAHARSHQEQ